MKVTTPLILVATAVMAQGATQVTLQNTQGSTIGYPIVDNTGTPIAVANSKFQVGTFEQAFADSLGTLDTLTADEAVLAAFTPTGADGVFARDGLFNSTIAGADNTGDLGASNTPLFAVVTYTPEGGASQALVFSFNSTFPTQDGAGNAAVDFNRVITVDDIVFGSKNLVAADVSGFPGPLQKDEFRMGFTFDQGDAIPEPSTSLLAGLAGLALVARRRR
ncbi:PEP-CTERM sorting domain-containing protein [Verrucomicrobiaceae bacterium 227]